jgi:predicted LPLAT superfamily acyltransferase
MPEWSGKSKGGALGYRVFIALIRYTGIPLTYFFIRIVALYYLVFSNKRAIRFYFREIHGYGRWKTLRGIYRNYCMLGEVLVDKVAMLSGVKTDFTFDFEGEEHLYALSREGKGAVLIGAHMGNWEMAGQLLDRIPTPVHILMLEAEHDKIRKVLDKAMVKRKLQVIPQKEDFSHLFLIREALERGEFVVIHGDRFLEGSNTLSLPFMGRQAAFPTGPLYLASKSGVPVSFVFTLKEASGHYHFYATPGKLFPYPAKIKTRKDELRKMLADYVESLEAMVRKYPFQWFNYYPFWKEAL